ncbi:MAG: hypothetical protein ABJF04_13395 [Reichenbachiella sp.]|uniref:hypothetical protein n=1 Tax=Reichenbachiella sp. TaxID=2184521 RepID=UPI003267018D
MKNGAQHLVKWTWLMVVAALLLVIVCVVPGFQYLVFEVTMIGSVISIVWVGFLLHATSH